MGRFRRLSAILDFGLENKFLKFNEYWSDYHAVHSWARFEIEIMENLALELGVAYSRLWFQYPELKDEGCGSDKLSRLLSSLEKVVQCPAKYDSILFAEM